MKFEVVPIRDVDRLVETLKETPWAMNDASARYFRNYIEALRPDLVCVIEFPYVDSVYRDSYYEYFASKHVAYSRDCVRISLFEQEPDLDRLLTDEEYRSEIIKAYLGFFVVRPTKIRNIGRSVLAPRAMKNQNAVVCLARYRALVHGLDVNVDSFPHSAQDSESMSCAETSLWTIMEYFSAKYQEYRPARSSSIRKALNSMSARRMVPSDGLSVAQLSYALNQLGFGSVIYSRKDLEEQEKSLFKKLFHYYIESGIPVIVAATGGSQGHAWVAIGHATDRKNPDDLVAHGLWMDTADLCSDYVVMDDNRPPFSIMAFDHPLSYQGRELASASIDHFIVPFYPKIYLDAYRARKLVFQLFENTGLVGEKPEEPVFLRFFITTARSFKAAFVRNSLPVELKRLVARLEMPKFIWVVEEASRKEYGQGNISGLMLLDATGDASDQSLLFLLRSGRVGIRDRQGRWQAQELGETLIFRLYQNNLKGDWNNWRA